MVEYGLRVGGLDGGGDGGTVVGEERLRRGAPEAVLGEVDGAGDPGLPGEDAEERHEGDSERTGGLGGEEGDAVVALSRPEIEVFPETSEFCTYFPLKVGRFPVKVGFCFSVRKFPTPPWVCQSYWLPLALWKW